MKRLFFTLALLLVGCVSSEAAWARVTSATLAGTFSGTGASHSFGALGAAVSVNHRIICIEHVESLTGDTGFPETGTAPTDTLGNTYTKDASLSYSASGANEDDSVWSAVVTTGGTPTITGNRSADPTPSSHTLALACGAYSGLSTTTGAAAAVDLVLQHGDTAGATTSTYDSGTTVGTTTAANELKIGASWDDGETVTLSAGTLDTTYSIFAKADVNGNSDLAIEDADSGASGSTARATVGTSAGVTGAFWGAAVVVYKLAGGGAPACVPTMTLLGVGRCG